MSLELNKIAGALLGTLTFAFGVGFISELIFEQESPEKPGFEVAVAEGGAAEGAGAAAPAEAVESIAVRLAKADPAKGETVAKACAGCHSFDNSGANKVGPGLWNVVNRVPGSHEGFQYSPAMVEFGKANVWDYDHLDHFLAQPKALVAGTKMGFAGIKKPDDRAAVIAYLRSLSDSPAALPAP
ncbi:c-type cytochrome [Oharaeibacter diazotrophicus]|uniref:Cytochrome c n=1 Tax=Oharaeibacter diazotrophicus TaxID=1920512 RepID=A0A4R6R912_9HYPH|nr:cytochrome c family protein [Oharaeibacter diazotrophicus]TDP82540.1 cytochrome c [Oharaeibacter diazotrophicus]BBE72696.1 cytochrome c-552 [Pleomorphomonas sp. SM30]GLS76731.1 cysteine desulfurase [Oharaeibacter diazotrophicus]